MNLPSRKPVLIIGAARQGQALARFLYKQGIPVILNDMHPASEMQGALKALESIPVEWVLGEHPLALLDEVDMVCVSGGVPSASPSCSSRKTGQDHHQRLAIVHAGSKCPCHRNHRFFR